MDQLKDVFTRVIGLTVTMQESIEYLKANIDQDKADELRILSEDMISAVDTIGQALEPVVDELADNKIKLYTVRLRSLLARLHLAYSMANHSLVKETLKEDLAPFFTTWCIELNRVLSPYLDQKLM
ncbi:MAG: hypothetical protein GX461_02500 [Clostridiales bacterium]|jgi:uncharacterized protein with HEPN domain|nr:hypothetical protein [Clostridiales bacterium]